MPLRDHFHSPLDDETSWDRFQGAWPTVIVMTLTRKLPRRYVALPRVHFGSSIEIDVATFEKNEPGRLRGVKARPAAAGWQRRCGRRRGRRSACPPTCPPRT